MKRLSLLPLLAATALAPLFAKTAHAGEDPGIVYTLKPRVHLGLGPSTALSEPQNGELSWGLGGSASVELPLAPAISLEAAINGFVLSDGQPPTTPRFRDREYGTSLGALAGVRVQQFSNYRPLTQGLWASLGFGAAFTGDLVRPTLGAHVGYDFPIGASSKVAAGPVVGYTWIYQDNSNVRPEDAHLLWFGVHVAFGTRRSDEGALVKDCADRDGDGVCDINDKCPDTAARVTVDESRPGCPRGDRDGDSIFDDEDACPEVPGIRTPDAKTNGCPRRDRDADTIFDDEDACPEEVGVRTKDPATNGCPRRDEDADTVFDDEDACPTVPGVRSGDPATNGCPPSKEGIRLEGDSILLDDVVQFELDSPRVRHVSWGALQKMARFFQSTPDILVVDIQGHADQSGSAEHNLKLSQDRADSVKALLVKFGVDKGRITTHAYGQMKPRTKGKQETDRSKNRRVEFVVIKAAKSGGGK